MAVSQTERRFLKYEDLEDIDLPGIYMLQMGDYFYIGSTTRSLIERIKRHEYRLRVGRHGNPILQNAYNKYCDITVQVVLLRTFSPGTAASEILAVEAEEIERHASTHRLVNIKTPDASVVPSPLHGEYVSRGKRDASPEVFVRFLGGREVKYNSWADFIEDIADQLPVTIDAIRRWPSIGRAPMTEFGIEEITIDGRPSLKDTTSRRLQPVLVFHKGELLPEEFVSRREFELVLGDRFRLPPSTMRNWLYGGITTFQNYGIKRIIYKGREYAAPYNP